MERYSVRLSVCFIEKYFEYNNAILNHLNCVSVQRIWGTHHWTHNHKNALINKRTWIYESTIEFSFSIKYHYHHITSIKNTPKLITYKHWAKCGISLTSIGFNHVNNTIVHGLVISNNMSEVKWWWNVNGLSIILYFSEIWYS